MTTAAPEIPSFEPGDGLLLVDPQNDFCPGGALPVAEGEGLATDYCVKASRQAAGARLLG